MLRSEKDPARREEVKRALRAHVPETWKEGPTLCLGCGDGFELDILCERGFKNVHGITNDPDEAAARPGVFLGDIHDMNMFGAGEFSFIYSKECLEHLISPWCALLEMNRILKPGGEFVHLISCGIEKQRETYHLSCFPDWLWFDLLHKAGFETTKILDGHATEIGFVGRKIREAEPHLKPEQYSYNLRAMFNGVARETIVL